MQYISLSDSYDSERLSNNSVPKSRPAEINNMLSTYMKLREVKTQARGELIRIIAQKMSEYNTIDKTVLGCSAVMFTHFIIVEIVLGCI